MTWINRKIYHFKNLNTFIQLAVPIIVSNSSETVMMFVDRLFLAHYSPLEGEVYISASLIGSLTGFMIFGPFVMTAGYTNALVSQFIGAGKKSYASIITMQSVYLAVAVYPLLVLLSFFIDDFFALFSHTALQTRLESQYTSVMLWGSILIIIRSGVSGFFIGIGHSRVVMVSNLIGMLINIPLNYALIYGIGFIPDLGILGAALATNIAVLTSLAILLGAYFHKSNRKNYATGNSFQFHRRTFSKLFFYGIPSGVELFFGLGAFNYFIMMMSSYGPVVGAAVTIAINWDAVFFFPMLGINSATMAMVGRYLGARDITSARNSVFLSIFTAGIYAIVIGIVLTLFPSPLVHMFLEDMAHPQEVYNLAVTMIYFIAFYLLSDALHISLEGALKGAGDTRAVMLIFISTAVVFVIAIYLSIEVFKAGPMVAWYIFVGYATSLGLGMTIRYLQGKWKTIDVVNS